MLGDMETLAKAFTYVDSLARPESAFEEAINGELHVMPPATIPHSLLLRAIKKLIDVQLPAPLDAIWGVGFLISEAPLRYRIPDLAIVNLDLLAADQAAHAERDPYTRIAPELVVEVLSPSNRKGSIHNLIRDYRDLGVKETLFLHPSRQEPKGIFLSTAIPNSQIDLDALWRIDKFSI